MNSLIWTENDKRISDGEVLNEISEKPKFNFEFDELIFEPKTDVTFRVLGKDTLRLTSSQKDLCNLWVENYDLTLDYTVPDRYKVVEIDEEEDLNSSAAIANIRAETRVQESIRGIYNVGSNENLSYRESAMTRRVLMSIIVLLDLTQGVEVSNITKSDAKMILAESIANHNNIEEALSLIKESVKDQNVGQDFFFKKS